MVGTGPGKSLNIELKISRLKSHRKGLCPG